MSERTKIVNGWTVDTLHEHIVKLLEAKEERDSERFDAQKEQTKLALDSADRAVNKAEQAAEKRFESVNEFRETLADQQRNLMPRAESELQFKSINDKVDNIIRTSAKDTGKRTGYHEGILLIVGLVALVSTILAIAAYFKH